MVEQPRHAGRGRVLAALVIGQMGMHSAMAGLRMAGALQVLREGHSAWSVGLLLALFAAAPVLTAMHAGRLADRLGYHRPVYLAVALAAGGALLAVASTFPSGPLHFLLLCLAAMATGAGTNVGMLTIQRTGGQAAVNRPDRVRIFSWLGVAPSFSNVIGPVAAGLVIDAAGFRAAYGLLFLLPLATLLTARAVPHLAPAGPPPDVPGRKTWDLLRAPGLARLLVVNWLLSTCWDVHTFAVPILGHERGFSASTIGFILGTFTLSVTLIRMLIPLFAQRLRPVLVLRSAMLGTGLIFALYPLAPNPWLMGACALTLGVTLGSVQPMVMSMLHDLTPDQRHGETLAFRSMAINASSTLMPVVFGATGTVLGAAVLFWAVGVAVGGGSWLARRLPGSRV
ncbi:MAG: MFS transporter [Rubrivivax sp.]|nr:MFS transporter [Rubrivivax sp.]